MMEDKLIRYKLQLMDNDEMVDYASLSSNPEFTSLANAYDRTDDAIKRSVIVRPDQQFIAQLRKKMLEEFAIPPLKILYSNELIAAIVGTFLIMAIGLLFIDKTGHYTNILDINASTFSLSAVLCIVFSSMYMLDYFIGRIRRSH